jgi:hypothetical protein
MATWDDVDRLSRALPEVDGGTSYGSRAWKVKDKSFAWERPLRPRDVEELGPGAPAGPVLAVRVADEGVKRALVADEPDVHFTTAHFDGFPAVLVRLDRVEVAELAELLTDAWLARAPKRLQAAHPEVGGSAGGR